ncbi:unnamed protein product [Hydatigera taeniaeformis]|uniref:C3H1-type domain-containing protein n=1 Tax=Hydatigena taeniaeformis TaxID=6205 RepID=A0A0R3X357_HYDTA|nr:unnamed protein product [Hydatigera taeniaeformis]
MGIGRRSRSPDTLNCEAPAEKMAKTSDSEHTALDNVKTSAPLNVLRDSGIASMTAQEPMLSKAPSNHTVIAKDSQLPVTRTKRQDWCRWPVCKEYYKTGVCPNEGGGRKDGTACQLAHVREEDEVSVIGDSYVRVCFESMGLVQHIRDQIIARRHAQYLQEKQVKIMRNQISNALMQVPPTPAVNPFVCLTDPLTGIPLNQYFMYNNYVMPDWTSATLLAANKNPYAGTDVNVAKLPPAMSIDTSMLIYPQFLSPAALIPAMNWTDYFAKMSAQYFQQRTEPITPYSWLPMAPVNSQLLNTMVPAHTALTFQPLGALNSVTPPVGVPPQSNVVPSTQATNQLPNVTR